MKCPRNNKKCKCLWQYKFINGYICSGEVLKPILHPLDKVGFCIQSGDLSRFAELTVREACLTIEALSNVIGELSPKIDKPNDNKKS